MSEEFWIAVIPPAITAAAAIVSNIYLNKKSQRDRKKDNENRDAVRCDFEKETRDRLLRLEDKIEGNTKRLDEHNGYGAKWANSNEHLIRIDEKLKNIEGDIKETKDEQKYIRKTIQQYHGGA